MCGNEGRPDPRLVSSVRSATLHRTKGRRELIAHRSGVIGADDGFTPQEPADDRITAERLAGQRPFWQPGVGHGYHALVIGALTGEVVRRTTGRSLQEVYEEVQRPGRAAQAGDGRRVLPHPLGRHRPGHPPPEHVRPGLRGGQHGLPGARRERLRAQRCGRFARFR
ncbi:serine hydrolase domain-containing protein [Streptomyces sp. NPDC015125]|uniref:serine hydrolase domain-containing protein n=1 Tax=Streptomyces sp. NPDC015125 TaxID=3364938 RepID=UPI0036F75B72